VITDSVSDMLTRIRNANLVRHQIVQIPKTKINLAVAIILKEEGYIKDFEELIENQEPVLLICLKYYGIKKQPVITSLIRISKPGLRIYVNKKRIPNVLDNLGIAILSTSKGVITNHKAKMLRVGGEVLCYIW
jgi:small subunit ribosomal protein S8